MPIVDLTTLQVDANEGKKREELIKKLQNNIKNDILDELNQFQSYLGKINTLFDNSNVLRANTKMLMLLEALTDEFANVKEAFNNNSVYYNDPQVMAFRKLVVTSIQQKKYSSLVDKINKIKG